MAARLTTYIVVAIVAATLIAGLIVGAQRDDNSGPVDLIVHNAAVYTADQRGTTAEAVAVRGNQILRVGREREIMRLRRPQTLVIDAGGATVLPGFNDVHAHPIEAGLALDGVDLLDAATVEEMQDRVALWAGTHPEQLWIRGRGWTYDAFDEDGPTRQQLDRVVHDRPVRLLSADGRDAWVNTKALQLAGIAREERTGGTGLLRGSAVERVERLVPAPTREERARALRAAIARAHEYGVTSLQLAGGSVQDVELFDEALRDRAWAMRIYSALSVRPPLDAATADALDAIWTRHGDDPLFKTGAISVSLDGPIDTGSAALLDPYPGRIQERGTLRMTPAQLQRIVMSMDARGWQVMIDATGDRAVRMALDAFQAAATTNDAPARGRRHRIEGAELVDVVDAPRFGEFGVIAAMQPYAAAREMTPFGVWTRQLGTDRAARGWPAASLAEAGARLAFGSGWPARPIDPMLALHAAVTRTRPDGTPDGGWHPEERLTLEAAINAYTSAAAWASFDEHRKGMIKSGMLADLVVLDRNVFDEPASALASATVDVTIFDGKVVYRRDKHRDTE